jgi:hypothetical protein
MANVRPIAGAATFVTVRSMRLMNSISMYTTATAVAPGLRPGLRGPLVVGDSGRVTRSLFDPR